METNCAESFRVSPLVAEMNDQQKAVLAELVTCRTLEDAEVVIRAGEISNELHVVVTRSLSVTRDSQDAYA